jgi:nucleotide-binding universal stress UspA family protein
MDQDMQPFEPQTILHPTDYSPGSQAALCQAAALACAHGAGLVVLHVVPTLGAGPVSYGEAASRRQPEGYHERLWEEFRSQVRWPAGLGHVELVLREGDPARAITLTAAELGCELIVMAGHDRPGPGGWLFRGVAERVLRRAPCSVLIVKENQTAPAARSYPGPCGSPTSSRRW